MTDEHNPMVETPADTPTDIMEESAAAWGLSLRPLGCPACGQAHLAPEGMLENTTGGLVCPNCAQAVLQPQPVRLRSDAPEKVIPFRVRQENLRPILAKFVDGVWLKCDDFQTETLLERARPYHLPMWLVDCSLKGTWKAEMGYNYQVKSSQEAYAGGGWHTTEQLESRLRWEPRLGQISLHYDNTITPAMSDHEQWTNRVGRFAPDGAQNYDPEHLKGVLLRIPDLDTEEAWPLAKEAIKRRLSIDCMRASRAGQLQRFTADLSYNLLNWSQLLLPVYATWYTDDEGKRHPIHINGQSGSVGGLRLASQRKGWKWAGITGGIGAGIFLLALIFFAMAVVFPAFGVIGSVLAVLAVLVLIAAIVPAVWPWQWNRSQRR